MGKFVIKDAKNGVKFDLKATNGQVIATYNLPVGGHVVVDDKQKIETYKAYYKKSGAEKACRQAIARYHQEAVRALSQMSMPLPKLQLLKDIAAKLENRKS